MPLKVEKRKFKDGTESAAYWIRGTIEGTEIFRSTKKTGKREAERCAAELEHQIRTREDLQKVRFFFEAVELYQKRGKEADDLPIINHALGLYPLSEITQELVDQKAREAYPYQKDSTVRRHFYDPVCTVLNYASKTLKWCPKIYIVKPKIDPTPIEWAEQEWFDAFWEHCNDNLYAFTVLISTTGARVSEAIGLTWDRINLNEGWAYLPKTKNKESRTLHLNPFTIEVLKIIQKEEGQVFPWATRQAVNWAIRRTVASLNKKRAILGLKPIKYLSTHKIGSHTYGTTMRRYAGLDVRGLVGTGRWKDIRSAMRYSHTTVKEEAKKSDLLPCAGFQVRAKSVQRRKKAL
ncbi:XerC Integrase [uncultured Caudovirales phage]|uniref:XerC Integrase n=1 Tax=uncultured Caudovirales phage TaxID=2100421 RepID=A0A6J5LZH1_9CAUD|nr:XerC Integrase [uncultured Caudovirales phage]